MMLFAFQSYKLTSCNYSTDASADMYREKINYDKLRKTINFVSKIKTSKLNY